MWIRETENNRDQYVLSIVRDVIHLDRLKRKCYLGVSMMQKMHLLKFTAYV